LRHGSKVQRFKVHELVKVNKRKATLNLRTLTKYLWLKEAFTNYEKEEFNKRKVVGALLADTFATSNWYQYYLTVMWYKERFFSVCKEQGLAIPR